MLGILDWPSQWPWSMPHKLARLKTYLIFLVTRSSSKCAGDEQKKVLQKGTIGKLWQNATYIKIKVAPKGTKPEYAIKLPQVWNKQCNTNKNELELSYEKELRSKKGSKHIIKCLGKVWGTDGGNRQKNVYEVYEWAGKEGSTVLQEITTFKKVFGLMKQVILALFAMQSVSPICIHHDLKWTNVAIDDAQCLRLTDMDNSPGCNENGCCMTPTPLYAPGVYSECRNSGYAWCPDKGFQDACPSRHDFDIFSAGLMAAEACALDWMFYAITFLGANPDIQAKIARTVSKDPDSNFPLLGLLFLRVRTGGQGQLPKKFEQLAKVVAKPSVGYPDIYNKELVEFEPDDIQNAISKTLAPGKPSDILNKIAQNAAERLRECQKRSDDVKIIESMIHRYADKRPTAAATLASSLFKDVENECEFDS